MPIPIQAQLYENKLAKLTIGSTDYPTITDTSSDTVEVRFIPYDQETQTPVTVEDDGVGKAAGTAVVLYCALDLVTPGIYEVEAGADLDATNPKLLLPNERTGYPYLVEVVAMKSY